MSRNSASTAYIKSSFDAMGSTRRLSDELAGKDHSTGYTLGSLGEDMHESGLSDGESGMERDTTDTFPRDDDNARGRNAGKESSTSNDVAFTSSSLGSIAKESSSDPSEDKGHSDKINEDEGEDGDYEDEGVKTFDQRSESDSDMESPDDFDGNAYTQFGHFDRNDDLLDKGGNQSNDDNNNSIRTDTKDETQSFPKQGDENLDNETTSYKSHYVKSISNVITSDTDTPDPSNYQLYESKFSKPAAPVGRGSLTTIGNKDHVPGGWEKDSNSNNQNVEETNAGDMYNKLQDEDVLNHNEKLDIVKDIGFGNMGKLQHLDKNDPALRRLFMRPRVTPGEAKTVKVDPDIKGMVNEFLRTNVAENFIIARVLRENYALFYSWLASHIQTERNSWAVRLSQALENADQERKGSLECRNLVVEAATRLRTLARTVSDSLYGINDNSNGEKAALNKGPSLRHGNVKGFRGLKGGGGANGTLDCSSRSQNNAGCSSTQQTNALGAGLKPSIDSVLRQSSFNMIDVSHLTSYESDPGTGGNVYDLRKKHYKNINGNKTHTRLISKETGGLLESKLHSDIINNNNNKNINSKCPGETSGNAHTNTESESMPFGYTINGIVVEYEDDTDWKQVLTESIDVLVEICDTFLTDRNACLRLISSKSSQFRSLVDALSTFIQDNQARDYFKRKEIEKRLQFLEVENKSMQDEMKMLKKTLLDKSEDALNLQVHLHRLESVVISNKADKLDKCVGTHGDFPFSKSHNAHGVSKGSKLSKSKNQHQPSIKTNHTSISQKLSKSPYAAKDSPMANGTVPSKISTQHNTKNGGYSSDRSDTAVNIIPQSNVSKPGVDLTPSTKPPPSRDSTVSDIVHLNDKQSFVEMSEEKLEKLKHRAKKLEDSLHDAISSMDTLNKSTPWIDKVRNTTDKPVQLAHIQKVRSTGNHHLTAKNIAYWKKSSFEIHNNSPSGRQNLIGTTITQPALEINKKKEQIPTNFGGLNLKSESSSLLIGRSIAAVPHLDVSTTETPTNTTSLRMISDRSQGLTPRSTKSHFDGYPSDDEDRKSLHRHHQNDTTKQDLSARGEISHKVRARRGQVKQIVSKCLRCQKLFSPTDNHKLACCYHTKEKERLEQYDHMGMLVRVIYAWKCCNQSQEADGCSFGKHV